MFDVKATINGQNWLNDDQEKKISWSKIRELTVNSKNPSVVKFKYNFEENQWSMYVNTSGQKVNLKTSKLQKAYNFCIPVPAAKVNDLLALCLSGTIPSKYHTFYHLLVPNDKDEEEIENLLFIYGQN